MASEKKSPTSGCRVNSVRSASNHAPSGSTTAPPRAIAPKISAMSSNVTSRTPTCKTCWPSTPRGGGGMQIPRGRPPPMESRNVRRSRRVERGEGGGGEGGEGGEGGLAGASPLGKAEAVIGTEID